MASDKWTRQDCEPLTTAERLLVALATANRFEDGRTVLVLSVDEAQELDGILGVHDDLLDALEALVSWVEADDGSAEAMNKVGAALLTAKAALAKAKGEV